LVAFPSHRACEVGFGGFWEVKEALTMVGVAPDSAPDAGSGAFGEWPAAVEARGLTGL
jgi:hypothetical protein